MIKNGILHRLILTIAFFLSSYFYLVYKDKNELELFAIVTLFLVIFILIPELKTLFKRRKIARIKRFDFRNLVFSLIITVPLLLLADYKTISSGITNLDSNFYNAFLWLIIAFLRRDNCYVITDKWIRYRGFDRIKDSTKINFKNIVSIDDYDDIVFIKTNKKIMKIDINKILKVERGIFEDELNKLKNIVHNMPLK